MLLIQMENRAQVLSKQVSAESYIVAKPYAHRTLVKS